MNKLFEYTKKVRTILDSPNAQILWHDTPYIQYEQIRLEDKFRMYYECCQKKYSKWMFKRYPTKNCLNQEQVQRTTVLRSEFVAANLQFNWLLILIVINKSDEHQIIYGSYYMELANNKLKFDRIDNSEKYLLNIQYLAWVCNGCLIASLKEYSSTPIF